jgi:hypothetical protein
MFNGCLKSTHLVLKHALMLCMTVCLDAGTGRCDPTHQVARYTPVTCCFPLFPCGVGSTWLGRSFRNGAVPRLPIPMSHRYIHACSYVRARWVFDNMWHLYFLACFTCSIQTVQWHITWFRTVTLLYTLYNDIQWLLLFEALIVRARETNAHVIHFKKHSILNVGHGGTILLCLSWFKLLDVSSAWVRELCFHTHPPWNKLLLYLTFKWTMGYDVVRYNSRGGSFFFDVSFTNNSVRDEWKWVIHKHFVRGEWYCLKPLRSLQHTCCSRLVCQYLGCSLPLKTWQNTTDLSALAEENNCSDCCLTHTWSTVCWIHLVSMIGILNTLWYKCFSE